MAFQLSPSVDIFEKNLSFNIANLPSAKTGGVIKANYGQAFKIMAIPDDAELKTQFSTPTTYNYKDWYNGWNFVQYANSLYLVRPIDQAKITKNTAIALSGGEGSTTSPDVQATLTTHQGWEQQDLYNQDIADLTIPNLSVNTLSKMVVSYDYAVSDWTINSATKLRNKQLVQKAATGADSGILQIGAVDTLSLDVGAVSPRLINLDELGGWTLSGDITLGTSEGDNFLAGDSITWGTSGAATVGSVNADVLSLTNIVGEAMTLTEAISGGSNSPGTGTVNNEYILLTSFAVTGVGPFIVTGTVSDVRLTFYHKYVTDDQTLGVAVCSNDGSWLNGVSTTVGATSAFNTFFEFRPDFASGEFAVIVFKDNGDGTFTDKEKFICSYNTTGKDAFNKNIFAEEVFLHQSKYLYCKVDTTNAAEVNTGGNPLPILHHSSYTTIYPRIGEIGTTADVFPATSSTSNGAYDANGYAQADIDEAFEVMADSATFDVNILMAHEDSFNKAFNISATRKDCITAASPYSSTDLVGKTSPEAVTYLTNEYGTVDADQTPLLTVHDTYSAFYGNMKYQYDKYNDTNRWISLTGDIAGLYAATDLENDPWWAPAGLNRGIIRNIIKLAFNPNKAGRDSLYINSINPVLSIAGEGTGIVLGQKTTTSVASAFDRVNVRRLMITIEKAIATSLRPFMFEFNDSQTRDRVLGIINPYLAQIKARRGVYDFLVVCDSSNNTSEIIDQNGLVVDIFVKPTKVAEFLQVNMIVTKTGTDFSELSG